MRTREMKRDWEPEWRTGTWKKEKQLRMRDGGRKIDRLRREKRGARMENRHIEEGDTKKIEREKAVSTER